MSTLHALDTDDKAQGNEERRKVSQAELSSGRQEETDMEHHQECRLEERTAINAIPKPIIHVLRILEDNNVILGQPGECMGQCVMRQ